MIRHVYSILCSKVSVDRETNNISLFETLESVQFTISTALTFPANVPFEASLVTLWARQDPNEPLEGEMRVRLLAPNGDQLGMFPNNIIDLRAAPRARFVGRINGLRVAGDGIHEWEIAYRLVNQEEWHTVASVPLEVSVRIVTPGAQPT